MGLFFLFFQNCICNVAQPSRLQSIKHVTDRVYKSFEKIFEFHFLCFAIMSTLNSPARSPSFRAERLFRSSTLNTKSPLDNSTNSNNNNGNTVPSGRKNVLLSENQLNRVM